MYMIDGEYQGTYSNNPYLSSVTSGEDNFGLDEYEPLFFHPLPDWISYGEFRVFLKLNANVDFTNTQDIFYFCHVSKYSSML